MQLNDLYLAIKILNMKLFRSLLTLTFFSLILITSGCKKEEDDPCDGVECGDGYCDRGACQCPEGFFGFRCDGVLTPKTVTVVKVELLKFPQSKVNSAPWDSLDGPDIHLTLYQSVNKQWASGASIQNADSSTVYSFDVTPPVVMRDLNLRYTLSLYDDDGSLTDEFMAGVLFSPYDEKIGAVATRIIDTGGILSVKLYLKYSY